MAKLGANHVAMADARTRFQDFRQWNGLVGGNRGALLGLAEAGMAWNIGGLRREGRKADQEDER